MFPSSSTTSPTLPSQVPAAVSANWCVPSLYPRSFSRSSPRGQAHPYGPSSRGGLPVTGSAGLGLALWPPSLAIGEGVLHCAPRIGPTTAGDV